MIRRNQQDSDNPQGRSETMNVDQADVAFAAFHTADICAMQAALGGELVLGETFLAPQSCDPEPESDKQLFFHAPSGVRGCRGRHLANSAS